MAKQKMAAPKNKEGEEVNLRNEPTTGGNKQFSVINPDFYLAVMTGMEQDVFTSKDGTKTYLKVQPSFVLLNDNGTKINRQDFTVGYYNPTTKELYHPENDFPIWGGSNGARFLFKAMGLFVQDEDGYVYDNNLKIVKDRAIKVRTGIGGYVKGNTPLTNKVNTAENFNNVAMEAIKDLTNGVVSVWGMEDLPRIIEWFNKKYELTEDNGLKTKNTLVGFYPVSQRDIAEHGWYLDEPSGAVFTTEAGWRWYETAVNEDFDGDDNSDW